MKNYFVKIPATLITNPDIDNFTIATYMFLSSTKSSNALNSFTMFHFCLAANKKEGKYIKSQLLSAMNALELDGRIKMKNTSGGMTYETTEHFCDDKKFAIIKQEEIKKILDINDMFLLRLFLLIKLKMIKGLYFQSFTSLGRLFNKDKKYIKKQCDLLQQLGLISNIRFTTSYKKKNETKFVRFHIFSDMTYDNWELRAIEYSNQLKEHGLKTSNYDEDDDLW